MGLIFEQICRQYLFRYAENVPVVLSDIGEWWGTDAKAKKEDNFADEVASMIK